MNLIKFGIIVVLSCYVLSFTEKTIERQRTLNSIEMLIEILVQEGVQFPEVALAQMLLETGFLQSKIAKKNFNLFGMKVSSRDFEEREQFGHAKYPHKYHEGNCVVACYLPSIRDYSAWQKQMIGKRVLRTNEDYLYFLNHLPGNRRYAEDPNYTNKLQTFIKNIRKCRNSLPQH